MQIFLFFCALCCRVVADVPTTPDNICAPNPLNPTALQILPPYNCYKQVQDAMGKPHPDQYRSTHEILEAYRYPYETHTVTTEDGYILTTYRITGSPNKAKKTGKKASVLLQHGLLSASDNWFWQPLNRNLPMRLADLGYDVWINNIRGSTYSQGHTTYNAKTNVKYWNFSWHEMGVYDIPAVINYILTTTKTKKIFYVGHSMGTTMSFVALSEMPELNKKIHASFLLSPVAFVGHLNNALKLVFPLVETVSGFERINVASHGYISTTSEFTKAFKIEPGRVCASMAASCGLCDNLLYLGFGFNAPQANYTELPNIYHKFPNTASIKTVAHYGQCNRACEFTKYDYGPAENLKRYNTDTPPSYNLSNIRVPQHFYYAPNDNLSPPNDVLITARHFRDGVVKLHKINDILFQHMDFLYAKDADKLLYDDIIKRMERILSIKG